MRWYAASTPRADPMRRRPRAGFLRVPHRLGQSVIHHGPPGRHMLVQVPVVAAFLAPHPVDQDLILAVRAVGAVAAAYARVLPGVPHGLTVRQA